MSVSSHVMCFSPLLFFVVCVGVVWCVPRLLFLFLFVYIFFVSVFLGWVYMVPGPYRSLWGSWGVARLVFFGFRGPYPMSAVWSLHDGVTSHRDV